MKTGRTEDASQETKNRIRARSYTHMQKPTSSCGLGSAFAFGRSSSTVMKLVTGSWSTAMPASSSPAVSPTIKVEQVKGFSLWVLRAVMSGRGDEVVDLAETALLPR
jgi:hypothetical protein